MPVSPFYCVYYHFVKLTHFFTLSRTVIPHTLISHMYPVIQFSTLKKSQWFNLLISLLVYVYVSNIGPAHKLLLRASTLSDLNYPVRGLRSKYLSCQHTAKIDKRTTVNNYFCFYTHCPTTVVLSPV